MSKVAIKGNASGTGTFTLEAPNSNTDRTLVLPDSAGTIATTNGVTMTDQWRLNTNFGVGTSKAVVNSGWERVDDSSAGLIGSSLTESSGVFSFPETGIYFMNFQGRFLHDNGANLYAFLMLEITEDNSTYDDRNTVLSGGYATNSYSNVAGSYVMDVTDISNFKFRFSARSAATNANLQGITDATYSGFTVVRIGDT